MIYVIYFFATIGAVCSIGFGVILWFCAKSVEAEDKRNREFIDNPIHFNDPDND